MPSDAVSLLGEDATPSGWGGRMCLALVNSVFWRRSARPEEQLSTYADLVDVTALAGWTEDPNTLVRLGAEHEDEAARVLARVLVLRERLLTVFAVSAAGEPVPQRELQAVQTSGARGLTKLRLRPEAAGGYRLRWTEAQLEVPLWQSAVSAVLLLASPELARVKQCPGEKCGWLFLDATRNHSRRWCSSAECGNRNRVQAHYRRTRAS